MRTILIGDVHGCIEELRDLLAELSLSQTDRLGFVGDLVDRGPDSVAVVRYVRDIMHSRPRSFCLAGNHEFKVLSQREKGIFRQDWTPAASNEDWAFLDSLPLLKKLPELDTVVVHGGFYPKFFQSYPEGLARIEFPWRHSKNKYMERARRFLYVRYVNPAGNQVSLGEETENDVFWTDRYDGREGYAFYGHQPYINPALPRISSHACGIDTACVFGGRLTAAIIKDDPRTAEFVSVPARAAYAAPRIEE